MSTAKLYRASDERRGLRIDSIQSAANPEPPLWSHTLPLWCGAYTLSRASKKLRETPQFKSFIVVRTVFALFFNGSLSQSSFMIVFILNLSYMWGHNYSFGWREKGEYFARIFGSSGRVLAAGCICVYKHPLILDICRRVCLYTHRRSQEILFLRNRAPQPCIGQVRKNTAP